MSDPTFEASAPMDELGGEFQDGGMEMGMDQAMAPQAAPVNYQKQTLNVYTVMLIVSLVALLFGIFSLYRVLPMYGEFPYWDTGKLPDQSSLMNQVEFVRAYLA